METVSTHGRRAGRLLFVAAALGTALLSLAVIAKAVDLYDLDNRWYNYGGVNCYWGGQSTVFDVPGPGRGASASYIYTSACQNGYRNLYAEGVNSLNTPIPYYSGWLTETAFTSFGNREDLCEVYGLHRMSKTGVDTSEYADTYIQGCF